MTRMAQAARGLLAATVGLALLMAAVVIGAVPAAAHGLESPRTVAAYTYGGAAPVVRGTATIPSPPTELIAPVRRGSLTAEGPLRVLGTSVLPQTPQPSSHRATRPSAQPSGRWVHRRRECLRSRG